MRLLLAVVIFAGAVAAGLHSTDTLDLDPPSESRCERGAILRNARLLPEAQEAYAAADREGHLCGSAGRADVGRERNESTRAISTANVFAATQRKETSILPFIRGLGSDPFEADAVNELRAQLIALTKGGAREGPLAPCKLASKLTQAGLLADAGLMVANGLEADPKQCKSVLRRLNQRKVRAAASLHRATALSAADDDAAARFEYARALRADPSQGVALGGLHGSLDQGTWLDEVGEWLAGIPKTLKEALAWVAPLVVWTLLVLLAIWIVLREIATHWSAARARLASLGKRRGLSLLRKAALPRVTVADFDGGGDSGASGKDFSALLATMLPKRIGREPPFSFDRLNTGSKDDIQATDNLSGALDAIPETKVLGELVKVLGNLFGPRSIQLSGHLEPIGDRGAGVTLVLEGTVEKTVVLWEGSYDPLPGGSGAARWLRLAPAATVWARRQLVEAFGSTPAGFEPAAWKADALFASGLTWQAQGELNRAAECYAGTLEEDNKLLPAAHNLATAELQRGNYGRARELLEWLRRELDADPSFRKEWSNLDSASLYMLALAQSYPTIDGESSEVGDPGAAMTSARRLVRMLAGQLESQLEAGTESEMSQAEERAGLENSEMLPSVVMLANMSVRHDFDLRKEAAEMATRQRTPQRLRLTHLSHHIERRKPWNLIDAYVLKPSRPTTRRTRYNLACYYTTLTRVPEGRVRTRCAEKAFEWLEDALVGGEFIRSTHHDPSLAPLKRIDECRFAKIVAAHEVKAHAAPAPAAE